MDFSDLEKHIDEFNGFLAKGKMKKVTHNTHSSTSAKEPASDTGVNIGKALNEYNAMFKKKDQ